MKYTSLKANPEKHIHIKDFSGGINASENPESIDNRSLSEGKNIYLKDGIIKKRPCVYTDESKALFCELSSLSDFSNYKLTDNVFYIDGIPFRIATEYMNFGFSDYSACIYLVDPEGAVSYIGNLSYKRTSSEIFYVPTHITFFQGKPQNGGGIFAFVSLNNAENYTESSFEIYEIDASFYGWNQINSFYIPTVLINGRGDSYEIAKDANQANTASPKNLESPNLLNGKFRAYFSSDGYSSAFTLPFARLTDETVTCRIYRTPDTYCEWKITSGETSVKQTFIGSEVTMTADRDKGILYFTVTAGEYEIPVMSKYRSNNIIVTASKECSEGFEDIVSSVGCSTVNSRIVFSGGLKNNRIYSSRYENPLYFPESDITEIGEARLPVTALEPLGNKLIAFKETEMHLIDVKAGSAINTTSLLPDNNTVFYNNDRFTVSTLSVNIGCKNANAITKLGQRLLIFASDGRIYEISVSGKITLADSKIKNLLSFVHENLREEVVAVSCKDYCVFAYENKAVTASLSDNPDISWFYWEFPEEITLRGGFSGEKSPVILIKGAEQTAYCAILSLENPEDILLSKNPDLSYSMSEYRNESRIVTRQFFDSYEIIKKRLNRIYINLRSSDDVTLLIGDSDKTVIPPTKGDKFKRIEIFPRLCRFNSFNISLISTGQLSFGGMDIFYEEFKG